MRDFSINEYGWGLRVRRGKEWSGNSSLGHSEIERHG